MMKILAVDDDPLALEILSIALNQAGYSELTTVASAKAALEILESGTPRFDCFLLDIMMPETDGVELCSLIRSYPEYAVVPIVMITALSDQNAINRSFQAGATDFVTKPFKGLELGARIRAADILGQQVKNAHWQAEQVDALRQELNSLNQIKLDESFEIHGVEGAVDVLALENKLLKSSKNGFATYLVAFRISQVETFYSELAATAFRGLINGIAGAIWGQVKSPGMQISYAGNGIFLCASYRPMGKQVDDLAQAITRAAVLVTQSLNLDPSLPVTIIAGSPRAVDCRGIDATAKSFEAAKRLALSKDMYLKAEKSLRTLRPHLQDLETNRRTVATAVEEIAMVFTRPRALGAKRS